jgi:hypothetical protein
MNDKYRKGFNNTNFSTRATVACPLVISGLVEIMFLASRTK